MKSTAIVCAIVAASFGFSSVSFAQGDNRHGRDDEQQRGQPQGHPPMEQHANRYDRYDRHGRNDQHGQQNYYHHESRFDQRGGRWNERRDYYNARGPEFHRGHYIPYEYRHRQYVVANYRMHRLPPPPRHHEWVQVGADYVLIAVATGLIASIILNH